MDGNPVSISDVDTLESLERDRLNSFAHDCENRQCNFPNESMNGYSCQSSSKSHSKESQEEEDGCPNSFGRGQILNKGSKGHGKCSNRVDGRNYTESVEK